jgi:hypothetical protein
MNADNESSKKYDLWLHNKKLNTRTQSKFRRVLDVYNAILEDEYSDSDYWIAAGDDLIISQLMKFEEPDWTALEADLIHWTPDQLFIVANALRREDNFNLSERILSKRCYLYGYIISIADDNIASDLIEDAAFLSEGGVKPLPLLYAIQERLARL